MSMLSKRFAKATAFAVAGAFAWGAPSTQAQAQAARAGAEKVQYWTVAAGTVGMR